MVSSEGAAMLGRGGGGGGGHGGASHAGAGVRGGGSMRAGGTPSHGLGLAHGHAHGGGHWHGHGLGHHRRFAGGRWWAWFEGYGWIVDGTGTCSAWGEQLEHVPAILRLVAQGAALLESSSGEPVSDVGTDGRRYLFTLAPGGQVPGVEGRFVEVWPCLDDVGDSLGAPETLGDDPSVATAANVAQIQAGLAGAMSPAQLQSVVQTYTGLGAAQSQSVLTLASDAIRGATPAWQTVAPLIAGGVSLIPGVGVITVAVVAAAVEFLPSILSALGIGSGGKCDWNVGGVCVSGVIPYGPNDPKWVTWDQFAATPSAQTGLPFIQIAFPDYAGTIGCELVILDYLIAKYSAPVTLTPVGGTHGTFAPGKVSGGFSGAVTSILGVNGQVTVQPSGGTGSSQGPAPHTDPAVLNVMIFLRSYYALWRANAEAAINGHPAASDADLLTQFSTSWNAAHSSASQYTFQPATISLATVLTQFAAGHCFVTPSTDITDPSVPTFVSLLLAGQIDGKSRPPLAINVGPALGTATPAAPSSGSSSSTGTAVAVAGGLTLLGILAYVAKVPASLFGGGR